MKKELIRKEFFKLKLKGHSYNQCRIILKAKIVTKSITEHFRDRCIVWKIRMVGIYKINLESQNNSWENGCR
jgi:hypothetical protein